MPVGNCDAPPRQARKGAAPFHSRGFSVLDLLVVVAIIVVISSLILTSIARGRLVANSARCLSNLHTISSAFSQYALDNEMVYPAPTVVNKSWESMLQPYVQQTVIFSCPSDAEIFPSVGSSYDWRDTSVAATTLAGQPLARIARGTAVLAFETLPGWHAPNRMNAIMVNGTGLVMTDDECLTDLSLPVLTLGTSANGGGY
jgi:type II secretory pathway pseudopilin PulG